VVSEIRRHVSSGWNRFFFVDEAIPYERFRSLSRELSKIKDNLSWICYLRLEQAHTLSGFHLARQSGCLKIFIGIETGSRRLMRLYRKGTTPDVARRIIFDASRAGLAVHLFLIAGFPDETEADRQATDAFLRHVLPSMDSFGFTYDVFDLKAEPGTPLCSQPLRFGAVGTKRPVSRDLCCEFRLISANPRTRVVYSQRERRIKTVVDGCLRNQDGLYNTEKFDDSTHLLLIESHLSTEKCRPSARTALTQM